MRILKLRRKMKKIVALLAVTSFLLMPANLAFANNITAGASGIGAATNITTTGNITNITGGHVSGNTGFFHFENFDVTKGGIANQTSAASQFVNMVNQGINIYGTYNALQSSGAAGNVIFVSPKGMVVGAGGVMNVGSLQALTPSQASYNALLSKAGTNASDITMALSDITALNSDGTGVITVGGKIIATTGGIDLKAGNGIVFQDAGILDTSASSGIGDISLFTNTGDIKGSNNLNIDANGNIVLTANNGGVASSVSIKSKNNYDEVVAAPLVVNMTDGKTLSVNVSETLGNAAKGEFKGRASVANEADNTNLASVKGVDVRIVNNGVGTLTATQEINGVESIYLQSYGNVDVKKNINAKKNIRIASDKNTNVSGNLTSSGNGFISVYAKNGKISMADAKIKMGNIDIEAGNGDVTHGNLTIEERGNYKDNLRLEQNSKFSVGQVAPDGFRSDGIHVTAKKGSIIQKSGTKINSAGKVDLAALNSVNNSIKAVDKITASGKDITLKTIDTVRLGNIESVNDINITGSGMYVDGSVISSNGDVNITSDKFVTIRPYNTIVDGFATYGAIQAKNNVAITAAEGIDATRHNYSNNPIITAINGQIDLITDGDIAVQSPNKKMKVYAGGNVNAIANNVHLDLWNTNGYVGNIIAATDAQIGALNDLTINGVINTGRDALIYVPGNITQNGTTALIAGRNAALTSEFGNIGASNNYLDIDVSGTFTARTLQLNGDETKGDIYINTLSNANIDLVDAGKSFKLTSAGGVYVDKTVKANENINITALNNIEQSENALFNSGKTMSLISKNGNVGTASHYINAQVGGVLNADAKDSVYVNGLGDLTVNNITAGNYANLLTEKNATVTAIISAGQDLNLTAGNDVNLQGMIKVGSHANVVAKNNINTVGIIETAQDLNLTANGDINAGGVFEIGRHSNLNSGKNINIKGDINSKQDINVISQGNTDVVASLNAGRNINIETQKNLNINKMTAGQDVVVFSYDKVSVGGDVKATQDINIQSKNDILRTNDGLLTSGRSMLLVSENGNIGAENNFLDVSVGRILNAHTLGADGNIYINGLGNVDIGDISTNGNVDLRADTLTQITPDSVGIKAGENVSLTARNGSIAVGGPNNLKVELGGALSAFVRDNVSVNVLGDLLIDKIVAGIDVSLNADSINQTKTFVPAITAGKDVNLVATKGDLGATNNHLSVKAGGLLNAKALSTGANANIAVVDKVNIGTIEATNDVNLAGSGTAVVNNVIEAGNDINVNIDGSLLQADNTKVRPALVAGNDLNLNSNLSDIGASDNYLTVKYDGILNATAANGSVYIEGVDNLNVKDIVAGQNVGLKANGYIQQTADAQKPVTSGKNMTLVSINDNVGAPNDYLQVLVGGNLTADAPKGGVYIGTPGDLVINKIAASKDVAVVADGYIHQTEAGGNRPAIKTVGDLLLVSNNSDVGDPYNYLTVDIAGTIDATAPKGGVYIEGLGNLNVDRIVAGTNVGVIAGGYIHQTADGANPAIVSGKDMNLVSKNSDVGDPNDYLQVSVGGKLTAEAPLGGVYIGSPDNLVVDQVVAGGNVGITSDGFIHQTDKGGKRPAIIAGKNLDLYSAGKVDGGIDVGDPNNYLTVKVGEKLRAKSENGGVYIEGYGDLVTDRIEAKTDIGIKGNSDIIIPHDKEDGNIIAGGNVKIEAGDDVVNAGGENVGIVADGDIEIIANLNQDDTPGTIGKLPYEDLKTSINVILNGEVIVDEIGVPIADKILNVNIMNRGGDIPDDGADDLESKTLRNNLKFLSEDKDGDAAKTRHARQDLRYNVAESEYILVDSNSTSGGAVTDVLNISKQGMLVETTSTPKVGEQMQVTMDYKGLPFTVDGTVVRVDEKNNTAGIRFNNIDQFTSSMILYLGMLNR